MHLKTAATKSQQNRQSVHSIGSSTNEHEHKVIDSRQTFADDLNAAALTRFNELFAAAATESDVHAKEKAFHFAEQHCEHVKQQLWFDLGIADQEMKAAQIEANLEAKHHFELNIPIQFDDIREKLRLALISAPQPDTINSEGGIAAVWMDIGKTVSSAFLRIAAGRIRKQYLELQKMIEDRSKATKDETVTKLVAEMKQRIDHDHHKISDDINKVFKQSQLVGCEENALDDEAGVIDCLAKNSTDVVKVMEDSVKSVVPRVAVASYELELIHL